MGYVPEDYALCIGDAWNNGMIKHPMFFRVFYFFRIIFSFMEEASCSM